MEIAGRPIGAGAPTYIVAELSANHRGSLDSALRLVEAAARAGVDAIKLQTYTPDTLTIDSNRAEFRIAGTAWAGRTLHDLYAEAMTPWDWHEPLQRAAADLGVSLFSSPFDETALEFLERLDVPAYKVASFEIVDLGLIARIAQTGKPMIISTGMATAAEIREAVETARSAGASDLALLKCTSSYPAPPEEANLATIPDMAERFGVTVGLSDHTLGFAVPIAAVALGAAIVEKHLTLSRADGGPDGAFSAEPHELREMVSAIRIVEAARGSVTYEATAAEAQSRILRRSLFVVEAVKKGEQFSQRNVRSIRPGHGLHTRHLPDVLGRVAARDIDRGEPLTWDLIQGGKVGNG